MVGANDLIPEIEDVEGPDDLIPDALVAKRYHVHLTTIWRWGKDPDLNFPAAIEINGRNYRRRRELQRFEREGTGRPAALAVAQTAIVASGEKEAMSSIWGRRPIPARLPPRKLAEVNPAPRPRRPRLAGTPHQPGWTASKRTFRAHLKELVAKAPPEKGGSERACLEVIDHAHLLTPRALRLLRETLAELVKISDRSILDLIKASEG